MEHHCVVLLAILLLTLTFFVTASHSHSCIPRYFGSDSVVCVCNATYCDTVILPKISSTQHIKYTSNQDGYRFRVVIDNFHYNYSQTSNSSTEITLLPNITYQTIQGWGGALTDSTGININSLNNGAKENLLRSYFSDEGIEYSIVRVPMGGTDFSTHAYSYDDGKPDRKLKKFKLAPEDYKYKIPFLKQALNLTNGNLRFVTSTWTAPKWMKTNHGFLKKSMYQTWADYFLKFLESYQKEGLEFWGITTGNEPSLVYDSNFGVNTVGWRPKDQRTWIVNNLGPTLRGSNFSTIKILVLDDQREYLPRVVDVIFQNKTAMDYIDGISVHWYNDKKYPPSLLDETHEQFSSKFIINLEASLQNKVKKNSTSGREEISSVFFVDVENKNNDTDLVGIDLVAYEDVSLKQLNDEKIKPIGSWASAEMYATDIMQDLHNWVTGWVDWNMALDMMGGPTYINNTLESPITVNAAKGELYKEPVFYILGHFSKFIPPGSVRIGFTKYSGNLQIVAFKRPDNGTVINVLNTYVFSNNNNDVIIIKDSTGKYMHISITPKSMNTLIYW